MGGAVAARSPLPCCSGQPSVRRIERSPSTTSGSATVGPFIPNGEAAVTCEKPAERASHRLPGGDMFDDQQIDLLPERTTMQLTLPTINVAVATGGISIPVNAGNINFGGTQV